MGGCAARVSAGGLDSSGLNKACLLATSRCHGDVAKTILRCDVAHELTSRTYSEKKFLFLDYSKLMSIKTVGCGPCPRCLSLPFQPMYTQHQWSPSDPSQSSPTNKKSPYKIKFGNHIGCLN